MKKEIWKKWSETLPFNGIGWSVEYYLIRDKKNSYLKGWETAFPLKEMRRRGHAGRFIVEMFIKGENKRIRKKYFKKRSNAIEYINNLVNQKGGSKE